MLSSHRFLCLPLRLPPWTVPCRIVLASPNDHVMCPYHFSLRLLTEVRRSSYGPMTFPILAFTSSLVMWSLYEIPQSLRKHLIFNACILLSMSAVMVHPSLYCLLKLLQGMTTSLHVCLGVSAPCVPRSSPLSLSLVDSRSEPACWCCWQAPWGCSFAVCLLVA